jgi:hypothetical protein
VGVLLAPAEAPQSLSEEVQSFLSDWIPDLGYRFQVRPGLVNSDFQRDDLRLVVALPPNGDVARLARDHPETKFFTLGIQGVEPAPNLTALGAEGYRLDQQGFVAGYMAAMITPDWRIGVIGFSGSDDTLAARQAFFTGATYYCGLCRPSYPPWYEYPLYFELGPDADTVAWRTAADYMIQRVVETVYVVPGAGDDAMLRHLAENEIQIIAGSPPPPGIEAQWVASLAFDLLGTFVEVWPDFVSGEAEGIVPIPMKITHINPDLLSPGKERLVNLVMKDVLEGYIDLGVDLEITP